MTDDIITPEFRIQPYPGAIRVRPSKAKLRKKLKDKKATKRERMEAYQYLQYRRKHGMR